MDDVEYFNEYYSPFLFECQKKNNDRLSVCGIDGVAKKSFVVQDGTAQCRFCGKTSPDATFKKKAHLFPESLGNKLFVSKNNECDECNGGYLNRYENDINTFLSDFLALNGIKGKQGGKKYKTNDKKTTIQVIDGIINLTDIVDSGNVSINEEQKTIFITVDIRSYSKINIYKLLAKMALAILPKNMFDEYSMMANYVKNKDLYGFEYFVFAMYPGFDFSELTVVGYKRKVNQPEIPSYYFLIFNNNFSFQIPLYADKDLIANNGKSFTIDVHFVPTPFDKTNDSLKRLMLYKIDRHDDIVQAHQRLITLSFDKVTKEDSGQQ